MDCAHDEQNGSLAEMMAPRIASYGDQSTCQHAAAPYRFLSLAEMFAETKETDWLIEDYIEAGTLGVLFGESGSMKTFAALDMAMSIACGHKWHGNAIPKAGPVYYIASEGYRGMKKRLQAWAVANNIPDITSELIFVASRPAQLRDDSGVMAVVDAIEELTKQHDNPRLIVIDTLNRSFGPGGDENSTADMTKFVDALDELKNRFGCAILVVHHTGQGDKARSRGSSALHCAVDFEFRLAKAGNTRVLTCTKAKDHEFPEVIMFAYDEISTGWVDQRSGREITSIVLRKISDSNCPMTDSNMTGLTRSEQIALEAFEMACGDTDCAHIDAWRERAYQLKISTAPSLEAKRQAFRRALNRLSELGRITPTDKVGIYRLANLHSNELLEASDAVGLQQ